MVFMFETNEEGGQRSLFTDWMGDIENASWGRKENEAQGV
jgi:hypothetical protein